MERTENRILLAEDNPDHEELALLVLRDSLPGCAVTVVRDGAAVLDHLFAHPAPADHRGGELPSLMLLDLKLPKVDALGVLREIRAQPSTRALPVVVLSSSCEEQDSPACLRAGADLYLSKPIESDRFSWCLQQLQAGRSIATPRAANQWT